MTEAQLDMAAFQPDDDQLEQAAAQTRKQEQKVQQAQAAADAARSMQIEGKQSEQDIPSELDAEDTGSQMTGRTPEPPEPPGPLQQSEPLQPSEPLEPLEPQRPVANLVQQNNAALATAFGKGNVVAAGDNAANPGAPNDLVFRNVYQTELRRRAAMYQDFVADVLGLFSTTTLQAVRLQYLDFLLRTFSVQKETSFYNSSISRLCRQYAEKATAWIENTWPENLAVFPLENMQRENAASIKAKLGAPTASVRIAAVAVQQLQQNAGLITGGLLRAFAGVASKALIAATEALGKIVAQFGAQLSTVRIVPCKAMQNRLSQVVDKLTNDNVLAVASEVVPGQNAAATAGDHIMCHLVERLGGGPCNVCVDDADGLLAVAKLYQNQFLWVDNVAKEHSLMFQQELAPLQQRWLQAMTDNLAWQSRFKIGLPADVLALADEANALQQAQVLVQMHPQITSVPTDVPCRSVLLPQAKV